jgi:hypothetical protein
MYFWEWAHHTAAFLGMEGRIRLLADLVPFSQAAETFWARQADLKIDLESTG